MKQKSGGIWWAVCSREDGTFLGAGRLNNLGKKKLKLDFGYFENIGAKV